MAAPTHIQAWMPRAGTGEDRTCDIKTVTKSPYTPPSCPSGLSDSETTRFNEKVAEDIRQTHVLYYKEVLGTRTRDYLLLPSVQPECPEEWSAEAWTNHDVVGLRQFHIFRPNRNAAVRPRPFILRCSDPPPDGDWTYENIGADSTELTDEVCSWAFDFLLATDPTNVVDAVDDGARPASQRVLG